MPSHKVAVNVTLSEKQNTFASEDFDMLTPYVVRNRLDGDIYIAIKVYADYRSSVKYSTLLIKDGAFQWASDPSKLEVIEGAQAQVSFDVTNP